MHVVVQCVWVLIQGVRISNLICKACCQCVIQSVMCLDVMIANLICARHVVVQGVDEAS